MMIMNGIEFQSIRLNSMEVFTLIIIIIHYALFLLLLEIVIMIQNNNYFFENFKIKLNIYDDYEWYRISIDQIKFHGGIHTYYYYYSLCIILIIIRNCYYDSK